jgi:hypothetical protein
MQPNPDALRRLLVKVDRLLTPANPVVAVLTGLLLGFVLLILVLFFTGNLNISGIIDFFQPTSIRLPPQDGPPGIFSIDAKRCVNGSSEMEFLVTSTGAQAIFNVRFYFKDDIGELQASVPEFSSGSTHQLTLASPDRPIAVTDGKRYTFFGEGRASDGSIVTGQAGFTCSSTSIATGYITSSLATAEFGAQVNISANVLQSAPLFDSSKVMHVREEFDKNQNKLSDNLEERIFNQSSQEVFISYESEPTLEDVQLLKFYGSKVRFIWGRDALLYGTYADVPISNITHIATSNPRIVLIDVLPERQLKVYRTTRQIRVRPTVWVNYGYDGNASSGRVAVVDSGIDDNHTDFSGKISVWTDCAVVGQNCTVFLQTLHDNIGHGSSVASIIVGTGAQAGIAVAPGLVNLTIFENFTSVDGTTYTNKFPYSSAGAAMTFNASLNWTGSSGQWQMLNISNGSIPDIGSVSGSSQPLTLTSQPIPAELEGFAQIKVRANNSDGVNSTGNLFIASFTTRLDNLSDEHNLLTGVADGTQVASVKVAEDDGEIHSEDLLDGVQWIAINRQSENLRIASMSLGGPNPSPTENQIYDNLISKGVIVVAAAGNEYPDDVNYPAKYNKTIAVGAATLANKVAAYSNAGNDSSVLKKPDVIAPGGSIRDFNGAVWDDIKIITADSNDKDCIENHGPLYDCFGTVDNRQNDSTLFAGTSAAVPHVSGLAAIIIDAMENKPGSSYTWEWNETAVLRVKNLILMTAWEVNASENASVNVPLDRGGKDSKEGYGVIAGDAAIEAVLFNYSMGSRESSTFGSGEFDKKVWARLINNTEGNFTIRLDVPTGADYDLYLYNGTPDSNGEPQILASSVGASTGNTEKINYYFGKGKDYYLVVKWVSGSGAFNLSSYATMLELKTGWNFIGFPTLPQNNSIGNVLSSISGKWNKIETYNLQTDSWDVYDANIPSGWTQGITTIAASKGYEILMKQNANLTLDEYLVNSPVNVSLYIGWNFFAWNGANKTVTETLASIAGNYSKIQTFNAASNDWEVYDSNVSSAYRQTLSYMGHGRGYWILMSANDTLEVT